MALINRTIRHKDAEDFNFDSADPEGLTCLHLAAMHCQAEASRVLLASGADPNVADGAGHTSLHYLCHTFVVAHRIKAVVHGCFTDIVRHHG